MLYNIIAENNIIAKFIWKWTLENKLLIFCDRAEKQAFPALQFRLVPRYTLM